MKITLLVVGKVKDKSLQTLTQDYTKRITRHQRLEIIELKDSNQERESQQLLDYIEKHKQEKIMLLDERGKIYTSKGLGTLLDQYQGNSEDVTFIIAGADGPTQAVKKIVKEHLALSTMTFTHEMARVLLLEQVYRIITIWNNIPYHKD